MSLLRFSMRLPARSNLKFSNPKQLNYMHAHYLFDEMPEPDIYTLNSKLASHFRNNDPLATWALFCDIHCTRTDLDAYTFTPVLGACSVLGNTRRGVQLHALMVEFGVDGETIPKTALMDMYSKYGFLGESIRLFDEMGFKDVVTWDALMSNYLRHGMAKKAIGVFEDMRREGVRFSEFTLCSVLKACTLLKSLKHGVQVHGLIVVIGRDLVILSTALVDFYSNVGMMDKARKVYRTLSCVRDNILQNSFIAACIRNQKFKEAFAVISRMRPNVVTLTSALAACSENSDLWIGKQIHCVATRFGFLEETQLWNAMLDMYSKCGKILTARAIFDSMPRKDVVSWTSMIDAYGNHGNGMEAVKLFKEMEKARHDVTPNEVTLLAVLSACSHSGMVNEGRQCFDSIQGKYGLIPSAAHYACYVDNLGRAGHIDEVWCVYDDMVRKGTKLTYAVWAALLNACGKNNDVLRGEFAARNLLELEPDKPGICVLISNFYAAVENWEAVDQLRNLMRKKGLSKDVGSSWISLFNSQQNLTTL